VVDSGKRKEENGGKRKRTEGGRKEDEGRKGRGRRVG
jgi:hypothetical protein